MAASIRQVQHISDIRYGLIHAGRPELRVSDPNISSTETASSEHASIYDASPTGLSDENVRTYGVRLVTPTNDQHEIGAEVPVERQASVESDSPAAIEAWFSNRPGGTPLTTILERHSHTSLRKMLSTISAKRTFAPVRIKQTSKVDAAAEKGYDKKSIGRLSLDDIALFNLQKRCQDSSDADMQSYNAAPADRSSDDSAIHIYRPPNPAFVRTKTPPGTPRWPGDLNQENRHPSTTRWLATALRSLIPSSGDSESTTIWGQRWQTSRIPQRFGQAYWQPPRSDHVPSFLGDSGDPFSHAQSLMLNSPLAPESSHLLREPRAPIARDVSADRNLAADMNSTIRLVAVEPQTPERWDQAEALMADIESDLANLSLSPTAVQDTRAAALPNVAAQTGHRSITILPVRDSSLLCEPPIEPTTSDKEARGSLLSPRDDLQSRYTDEGIPIYGPDAHNTRRLDVARPKAANRTRGSPSSVAAYADIQHRDSPHSRGISMQPSLIHAPSSNLHAVERRIVSAALPVLLPIAAREGIVTPIDRGPRPLNQTERIGYSASRGDRSLTALSPHLRSTDVGLPTTTTRHGRQPFTSLRQIDGQRDANERFTKSQSSAWYGRVGRKALHVLQCCITDAGEDYSSGEAEPIRTVTWSARQPL